MVLPKPICRVPAAYWVAAASARRLFPNIGLTVTRPSPGELSPQVYASKYTSSSEAPPPPGPKFFNLEPHPPGFHPSSRHHRAHPLPARAPRPRFVPPSGFLSLPTVSSALGFAGLFHPATTSRVSCSGFLPQHSSTPLSGEPYPLAVKAQALLVRPAPRLRLSTSRPYSVPGCVPQERGLAGPLVAPFFSFLLLAFSLLTVSPVT